MTDPLDPAGVARVRLWLVEAALLVPFAASHGTETQRCSTLVEVALASGATGWGECPALSRPTYTHEYAAGAWRLLVDELVPAVLAGRGGEIRGHPMARSAVAAALWDARLREQGRSLADRVAPGRLRRVPRGAVIGRQRVPEATIAAVAAALEGGVELVKLKVGSPHDRQALVAVRRAFPDVQLAADANGAFSAVPLEELRWIDDLHLAYLEQPLAPGDLVGHARLARALATPVALDESIDDLDDLATALELGAIEVLNVKAARLGGPHEAIAVIDACAEAGVPAFVGGMLELGVGRALGAALALRGGCTLPTDLGPSSAYVAEDVSDPVVVDAQGRLVVPGGPGIGVEVHLQRLAAMSSEVVELRP
ncbi:MAG: o-succinylbenzoate synthase [Acidimicrobiia bacterium]|nr:o-succinylbenzoate synthase [Acidimicrobiia bacterium]